MKITMLMAYPRQQKRREFYTFPAMKIFLVRRQITYRSHLVDLWLKSRSVRQSDEQEKLFFLSLFFLSFCTRVLGFVLLSSAVRIDIAHLFVWSSMRVC